MPGPHRRPTCWRGSSCASRHSFRELVDRRRPLGGRRRRRRSASPASSRRPASTVPTIGQHSRAPSSGRRAPDEPGDARDDAPLAGLRVVDMTWVWAGPFGAMQLAHLGADVVKIESRSRVDVTRRLGPFVDGVPGIDRSGYFNQFNQGKRSVCLDPTTQRGQGRARPAAGRAPTSSSTTCAPAPSARMGFDDARLRQLNPDIVAVAMTGYGETGPEKDKLAYGSLIDALAGVTAATGPVDGPPTEVPMSLPDPSAGLHAALGTTAALVPAAHDGRRRRHGVLDGRGVDQRPAVGRADDERRGSAAAADRHPRRADGARTATFPCRRRLRVGGRRRRRRRRVRPAGGGDRPARAGRRPPLRVAGRPPGERGRARGARRPLDDHPAARRGRRGARGGGRHRRRGAHDGRGRGVGAPARARLLRRARPPGGRHRARWAARRGAPRARRCARCVRRRCSASTRPRCCARCSGCPTPRSPPLARQRGVVGSTHRPNRRSAAVGTTPPMAWNQIVVRFSTTSASSKSSSRTSQT